MEQVRGVPELLDGYTEDTLPVLDRVRAALDEYRVAVAAFNAAEPKDLGAAVSDRSDTLLDTVDALEVLDRIPAAFAAALRDLDTTYDPDAFAPGMVLQTSSGVRLRRLLLDGVAGQASSGAQRARVAQVLRGWDDVPDPPEAVAFAVKHEGWRSAIDQFGRHAGNSLMSGHESHRLTVLRARYPVSREWVSLAQWTSDELARAGGIHNRAVLQAARSAEDASLALRGNSALLPTLGVHIPSNLLVVGKAAGNTVGAIGMGLSVADGYQDYREGDVGGVISNGFSIGGGLLMLLGGPVTITTGAVFIVGSLIYEANRETVDSAVRAAGLRLKGAANAMNDFFAF